LNEEFHSCHMRLENVVNTKLYDRNSEV